MSDNFNLKENSFKTAEVYSGDLTQNPIDVSSSASTQISDTNENECNKTDTVAETKECTNTDLLVKLGNDTAVYNISKSLERVRYIINSISMQYMSCSPILPYHKSVTYVSEAHKIIKDSKKQSIFKFVSSYPSSSIRNRKNNKSSGIPVIIIGDVTSVQEDQCAYVFICVYINELTAQNVKATNALKLLGTDELSDDSSSVDSSDDSSIISSIDSSSDEEEDVGNETSNFIVKEREGKPTTVDVRNPLVFLEDGAADKLPPVRECDLKISKQDCIEIGYVMHIHELLVTVQGLKDSPALNADTLLFLDDDEDDKSLQSLGFIYEIIGPVDEPVYCITFKDEQNIGKKQIKQGAQVYISSSCEHTRFVFVQDLLKQKGSDASWKNDVEPPEQFIEYSDDEEERQAKQRLKRSSSETSSNIAATSEDSPQVKRKRQNSMQVNGEVDAQSVPSVGLQHHHVPSGPPEVLHNAFGPHHLSSNSQQIVHRVPGPPGIQYNGIDPRQQMAQRPPGLSGIQYNGINPHQLTSSSHQMAQRPPGPPGIQYNGINRHHLTSSSHQMPQRPPGPPGIQYNGVNPHHLTSNGPQMPQRPPGPPGIQYNGINPHSWTSNGQQVPQIPPAPPDIHYSGTRPQLLANVGQRIPQHLHKSSEVPYNGADSYCSPSSSQQMPQQLQVPPAIQQTETGPQHFTRYGQRIPQQLQRPSAPPNRFGQQLPNATQLSGIAVQPARMHHYRFSRPAAAAQEPPRIQPYPRPPVRFL